VSVAAGTRAHRKDQKTGCPFVEKTVSEMGISTVLLWSTCSLEGRDKHIRQWNNLRQTGGIDEFRVVLMATQTTTWLLTFVVAK
jgi:hypothetical protein